MLPLVQNIPLIWDKNYDPYHNSECLVLETVEHQEIEDCHNQSPSQSQSQSLITNKLTFKRYVNHQLVQIYKQDQVIFVFPRGKVIVDIKLHDDRVVIRLTSNRGLQQFKEQQKTILQLLRICINSEVKSKVLQIDVRELEDDSVSTQSQTSKLTSTFKTVTTMELQDLITFLHQFFNKPNQEAKDCNWTTNLDLLVQSYEKKNVKEESDVVQFQTIAVPQNYKTMVAELLRLVNNFVNFDFKLSDDEKQQNDCLPHKDDQDCQSDTSKIIDDISFDSGIEKLGSKLFQAQSQPNDFISNVEKFVAKFQTQEKVESEQEFKKKLRQEWEDRIKPEFGDGNNECNVGVNFDDFDDDKLVNDYFEQAELQQQQKKDKNKFLWKTSKIEKPTSTSVSAPMSMPVVMPEQIPTIVPILAPQLVQTIPIVQTHLPIQLAKSHNVIKRDKNNTDKPQVYQLQVAPKNTTQLKQVHFTFNSYIMFLMQLVNNHLIFLNPEKYQKRNKQQLLFANTKYQNISYVFGKFYQFILENCKDQTLLGAMEIVKKNTGRVFPNMDLSRLVDPRRVRYQKSECDNVFQGYEAEFGRLYAECYGQQS